MDVMKPVNVKDQVIKKSILFPDTTILHKWWTWKDNSNTLEQISNNLQVTTDRHISLFNQVRKANKRHLAGTLIHSSLPTHLNPLKTSSRCQKQNLKILTGLNTNFNASTRNGEVTFNDVKAVSFDLLLKNGEITESFQASLRQNQFDGLLLVLLNYFQVFFEKCDAENKERPVATELGVAEIRKYQITVKRLEFIQKQLAEKYCSLILGLEGKEQHHMSCGSQRKSYTKSDRLYFEALQSYCCNVIWVCFKRPNFELIQRELGRLFRSPSFNSYGRISNRKGLKLASDAIFEDIHDIKLTPSTSTRNQRSPVFVSLFPTSQDTSSWLLDRRKTAPPNAISYDKEITHSITTTNLKIGIIGKMFSDFNPNTLIPNEEDNAGRQFQVKNSVSLDGNDNTSSIKTTTNDEPTLKVLPAL